MFKLKTTVDNGSDQKIQELENRLAETEQSHQRRIDELNGQKDQEMSHLRGELESVQSNLKTVEESKSYLDHRIQELERK